MKGKRVSKKFIEKKARKGNNKDTTTCKKDHNGMPK